MIRNFSIRILFFLTVLSGSLCASAAIGDWTLYPVFSVPATHLSETSGEVYCIAGGNLFSYNPTTDERRSLTVENMLSDYEVTDMFYNPSGQFLAVGYAGGNIDLIYDDGSVVNLPDIKVATSITGSRLINDIAFDGDRMYVATDFGLVIYDTDRHEVVRSGNLGMKVSGITIDGDRILVLMDNKVYYADINGQISKPEHFKPLANVTGGKRVWTMGDNTLVFYCTSGNFWFADYNADRSGLTSWYNIAVDIKSIQCPVMHDDSTLAFSAADGLYTIGTDRIPHKVSSKPEQLADNIFAFSKGNGNVWALGNDGLGLYDLTDGVKVKKNKFLPETMSVKEVASIIPSADGERIYFINLGPARMRLTSPTEGEKTIQQTCVLENGRFTDVAPYPVEAHSAVARQWQQSAGKWIMSPSRLIEDPDDPQTYFVCTNTDGIYRVTDGEVSGHYDINNMPLVGAWSNSSRVFELGIDRGGNLWAISQRFKDGIDSPMIMVLPASKRKLPSEQITADDWKVIDVPSAERGDRNPRVLFCKHSQMVFVAMSGLLAIDSKGTFNSVTDDKLTHHSSFIDQDGKSFSFTTILSLCEDHEGRVWVGTDQGIFEITNPTSANSSSMVINHLKIPRNDGTNTAEYLLPADYIYAISTDNANRKWVATRASGLFLVSERGDRIIANYTSDNSPLPDNMVHDVYADVRDNTIWVGTSYGLMSLTSDASPVHSDYSDIYAYPNPVRPDHTGPICIVGLMDNTLVKITDASGMLVAQVMAEGGMAQWDGCNLAGSRVKSGVYYVFASSGGGDTSQPSSGAVTKILVVN